MVGAAPRRPAGPLLSHAGWIACAEAPVQPKRDGAPQQPRPRSPDGRASCTSPGLTQGPRRRHHRQDGQTRNLRASSPGHQHLTRGPHDFLGGAGCAAGTRPLRIPPSPQEGAARRGWSVAAWGMDCLSSCLRPDALEPGSRGSAALTALPGMGIRWRVAPSLRRTLDTGLIHFCERLAFQS